MTRLAIILLLVGAVLGLAFALTDRSSTSPEGVGRTKLGAPPAASRGVGTSTLSHGGPARSGPAAKAGPGTAYLDDPAASGPDRGRRSR